LLISNWTERLNHRCTVFGNPGVRVFGVLDKFFWGGPGGVLGVVRKSRGRLFCVLLHFYNQIFRTLLTPSPPRVHLWIKRKLSANWFFENWCIYSFYCFSLDVRLWLRESFPIFGRVSVGVDERPKSAGLPWPSDRDHRGHCGVNLSFEWSSYLFKRCTVYNSIMWNSHQFDCSNSSILNRVEQSACLVWLVLLG